MFIFYHLASIKQNKEKHCICLINKMKLERFVERKKNMMIPNNNLDKMAFSVHNANS